MALIFLSAFGCKDDRELQEIKNHLDSVSNALEVQQRQNDSLEKLVQNTSTGERTIYFGKAFDTIDNPKDFLKESLNRQREKIPVDAVLGGSMEFRQVEILTEDWILAVYDDGHIQGKSIYRYALKPNGEVEFTEIVSKLPNGR